MTNEDQKTSEEKANKNLDERLQPIMPVVMGMFDGYKNSGLVSRASYWLSVNTMGKLLSINEKTLETEMQKYAETTKYKSGKTFAKVHGYAVDIFIVGTLAFKVWYSN